MKRKWKWMLSLLLVFSLSSFMQGVTHAAGNNGTSVYDTIKSQNQTSPSKQNKGTTPAQTKKNTTTLPQSTAGGTFLTFLKLVVGLGVVLTLIYLFYRFLSKRTRAFQSVGHLRNLGGVSVGANRSVQLVKVGDEVLLVGVGENVSLLKNVDDENLLEVLLREPETASMNPNVNRLVEWAKEAAKTKSGNLTSKLKFKNQLDQILKEREEGLEEVINKESNHE